MNKICNLRNGETYSIRAVKLDDASELLKYLKSIAGESDNLTFGPGESNITFESECEFIKNVLNSSNQYFVVAEIDGKIIGNINFSGGIKPRLSHYGEFGVSVLEEYWGNGIASQLLTGLIEWAKEGKKITKINLQVKEENENAIKLYKKFGFEIEGLITRTFYIRGEYYNSYCMGKIIS